METKIKQFWEYFEKENFAILEDIKYGIPPKKKFELLTYSLQNIHPKLQILINRPPNGEVQFVLLSKGRLSLKILITEILKNAPPNEHCTFKMGLPPWTGSLEECCSHYKFLGPDIHIYEVYFDIYKYHPSNGKVNLQIHVEKNKPLPKNFINSSMRSFFIWETSYSLKKLPF